MTGDTIVSILERLIDLAHGEFPVAVAEAFLSVHFSDADQARIDQLATRCAEGVLTAEEAVEYDGYIAAADLLSLWQSKARLSLKQQTSAA